MSKCRHKKGIILASAWNIEFVPDREPFQSGVMESSGIETIDVGVIDIHYCPQCKQVVSIDTDGEIQEWPLS